MAGMDGLFDTENCEALGNMVTINASSWMSTSPALCASLRAFKLEDGSIGDGPQGAPLSFGTAHITQEEDLVLSMIMAGKPGQCVKSHQLLGAGKRICNSLNDCPDVDVESFTVTQPFKGVKICAICHEKIKREETAEIKGCEHSYCVTCILRWATYKAEPWCPQCRLPFAFLYVYRALDGSLSDYLFEESVCLLLRAFWFKPLVVQETEEQDDYQDDYDAYEEPYYTSTVRLGNRRWGDSGYVRAGRREARPVGVRQVGESSSSSSKQAKGKEPAKETVGRRARRAQKREQLDKMAAKT